MLNRDEFVLSAPQGVTQGADIVWPLVRMSLLNHDNHNLLSEKGDESDLIWRAWNRPVDGRKSTL